jgi:methylthioribose-1-phosphate isomerase
VSLGGGRGSDREGVIPTLKTGRAHTHPEPISGASYSAVELMPGDKRVLLLDQRLLPRLERYELLTRVEEVAQAIRTMMVRGAPSIGIAAAYGIVLAGRAEEGDAPAFLRAIEAASALLRATRPTAKNLDWALSAMQSAASAVASVAPLERGMRLGDAARAIHVDEVKACQRLGELGAANVPDGARILTYCNAGALATGGYGSALGVVRAAREAGKRVSVIASETRPLFQGSRLTAWELAKDGIPVEVITDSMVASLMARRQVDLVIVGADRIARSGDVANKIGTYGVACLAQVHGVPFDVAAPMSTIDMACASGEQIPIEERAETEVTHLPMLGGNERIVPDEVHARNPSFDVTPARLVRSIVTERGVVHPVTEAGLAGLAVRR